MLIETIYEARKHRTTLVSLFYIYFITIGDFSVTIRDLENSVITQKSTFLPHTICDLSFIYKTDKKKTKFFSKIKEIIPVSNNAIYFSSKKSDLSVIFSHFFPSSIVINVDKMLLELPFLKTILNGYVNMTFLCVEHAYQWFKIIFFQCPLRCSFEEELSEFIIGSGLQFTTNNWKQIGQISKRYGNEADWYIRQTQNRLKLDIWEKNQLNLLEYLDRLKAYSCKAFRNLLISSNSLVLKEDLRSPWGIHTSNGQDGKNYAGLVLMRTRRKIFKQYNLMKVYKVLNPEEKY